MGTGSSIRKLKLQVMEEDTVITSSVLEECDEAGAPSGTPVLLIHGFLDEGSLWGAVAEKLAQAGYAPRTLDLPGMGGNADHTGPFTLDLLAAAVIAALDAIGKPTVLVGHSMGTQLAELVAVERPHLVPGLVLMSPVPLGGMQLPDEIANAMRRLGGDRDAQRQLRTQFAWKPTEQLLDELVLIGLKPRAAVVVALFEAWSAGHSRGRHASVFEGPVAILGGEQDGFASPEFIKSVIAPRFHEATTSFINGAGHWPHVEQPEAVTELIEQFLSDRALTSKTARGGSAVV